MKLATALTAAILSMPLDASAATIQGYNIQSAIASGGGNWFNTHNGTIVGSGNSSSSYSSFSLVDLAGGSSGTLNDGIVGTAPSNTHLLSTADNVIIDLFFDASYWLSGISLFSFNNGNSIPGSLTGFDVSWTNGSMTSTATFTTTQDAALTEFASFLGSALEGVAVSSLTLSNFTTNGQFYDLFAISEISLASTPVSAVPLPASGLLLLAGAAGLGLLRRRKAVA